MATSSLNTEPNYDDNEEEQDSPSSSSLYPNVDPALPPLDERVLNAVRNSPNFTIRPAKLASELGISIDDASAELCGLLSAVGGGTDGATFHFEEVRAVDATSPPPSVSLLKGKEVEEGAKEVTKKGDGRGGDFNGNNNKKKTKPVVTMVFTFPPDFEQRALRTRRINNARSTFYSMLQIAIKVLKVFVAFGLIISLTILAVGAILSLVAFVIATSRGGGGGGGHHHRSAAMHRIRSMVFTLRQLLWCYVVFGDSVAGNQDLFLREVAYNIGLFTSLCCGSPFSLWWWIRAGQFGRRRRIGLTRSTNRGWGARNYNSSGRSWGGSSGMGRNENDLEGVALVRQGNWSTRDDDDRRSGAGGRRGGTTDGVEENYRGLLSTAVEFLFGPTPFWPGPSESDRWKIRAAVIVSKSSESSIDNPGISLEELTPYSDHPPSSVEKDTVVVSEGLRVVTHFNGIPAPSDGGDGSLRSSKARFVFPELVAEADDALIMLPKTSVEEDITGMNNRGWESLLYTKKTGVSSEQGRTLGGRSATPEGSSKEIPTFLCEQRHALTKLQPKEFGQCVFLGVMNYIGLIWLRQSIDVGGPLQITNGPALAAANGTLAFLLFYAKFFLLLPAARLVLIIVLNQFIDERNRRRSKISESLNSSLV